MINILRAFGKLRHGVNSIPEMELMDNSGIGIAYLNRWNWN